MLALTVLETCVKNCGHRFHVLVASRDFIDSVLVKIISPKNSAPAAVQDKVLALIQAWADAFRSSPDLTGVVHAYEELKRKGVEFPMADLDALSPIHTPQRSVPEVDPAATTPRAQPQPKTSRGSYAAPQAPPLSASGPITASSEQITRLRSELDVVRGNTKVMSEMLTEMVPGQEDSSDLELLQELHRTCRAMQQRVVELISRVCNEEVTEELLHVNDDLNNVFLRYERFERYRSGQSVQSASNGVLREVTEDNLIDLGPGSPAVVSPTVGSTAPPSSLSSQLAGLDLGAEGTRGTLRSLQHCPSRDGFDAFTQTRGGSAAAQRRTRAMTWRRASQVKSSISSWKKGPKLPKWFPTSPLPQQRLRLRPQIPPAGRSRSGRRTPSLPCELSCGWAPPRQVPSHSPCPHQALAVPPMPSPHLVLCCCVSMETPLCLLPGLPLVRTSFSHPPVGRWDRVTQRPPSLPTSSLWLFSPRKSSSGHLPTEKGLRPQPLPQRAPAQLSRALLPSVPYSVPERAGLHLWAWSPCPDCCSRTSVGTLEGSVAARGWHLSPAACLTVSSQSAASAGPVHAGLVAEPGAGASPHGLHAPGVGTATGCREDSLQPWLAGPGQSAHAEMTLWSPSCPRAPQVPRPPCL
ncbi:TOM1-like protein 2 isoform X4 [Hippopotamus amphibius kiboko]|nr:TOM1-like protein 2 isoform X4 [Hippopotamus amphibius kiboko]